MNILFLCKSNVARSQMAEVFFNKYSKVHKAKSAAIIKPQEKMHKLVVRAMAEIGIDISKDISKKVTEKMIDEADVVILMNKNLKKHLKNIRDNLKKNVKVEFWEIPDVVAKETDNHLYQNFVNIREIIMYKVLYLIKKLNKKEI